MFIVGGALATLGLLVFCRVSGLWDLGFLRVCWAFGLLWFEAVSGSIGSGM